MYEPETDFDITSERTDNDGELFIIKMPKPVQILNCKYIGIFIDRQADTLRYFTYELDFDYQTKGKVYFLCEWDKNSVHYNYGSFTNDEINFFSKEIRNILEV